MAGNGVSSDYKLHYGTTVSGHSRAHLGNHYGDQINHYAAGSQDQRIRDSIIKSLEFEGQGQRSENLPSTGRHPYKWILDSDGRGPAMPYIPPWFSLDAPIRGSLSPADKLFQGQEKLSSLRKIRA
jgi:hypothetical protein